MRRRGFTLIEMLVVIALIALLATMLVMAIGKMQTSGKRQQTRLILTNLTAMFADYDKDRRVPFGMGNETLNTVSNPSGVLTAIAIAAPGDVTSGGAFRTGAAVQYTRDFMGQLMSDPTNATAIGKLPSSSLMTFAAAYPAGIFPWNNTTLYDVYGLAADNGGNVYIRTVIYPGADGAPAFDAAQNAPPNYYYWIPALAVPSATTPLPTPVVLDAWGNPIIFVMGGVLSGVNAGGQTGININSPDYHPFFASAGPDGNFSSGDDNLYSFEK